MRTSTNGNPNQTILLVSPMGTVPGKSWSQSVVGNIRLGRSMRLASLCLLIYWAAIFVGTHLPGSSLPHIQLSDKLLHLGAYTGLAFLVAWAIPTNPNRYGRHAVIVFCLVLAYGCIDELTQNLVPGRSSSLLDLAADASGAILGISIHFFTRKVLSSFTGGRFLLNWLSR